MQPYLESRELTPLSHVLVLHSDVGIRSEVKEDGHQLGIPDPMERALGKLTVARFRAADIRIRSRLQQSDDIGFEPGSCCGMEGSETAMVLQKGITI